MLKYALGGIVLSTSLHSAALSLGAATGSAIIGSPLDISVRSSAPLADIESAGCLQAQVLYGDTTLPAGSVSLSVQGTADGAVIRVRSSVPVNEPVVSVVLNTGCAADRFSRKYTLLADLDPSLAATPSVAAVPLVVLSAPVPAVAPPPVVTLAPLPAPSAAPAAAPSLSGAQISPPPAQAVPAPRVERAAPAPAPRPAASAPPQPRPVPKPPAPPRPAAQAPAPAAAAAPTPAPAPAPKAASTVAPSAPAPAPRAAAAPAAPAPAPVAAGPRLKLDPVDLSPGRNPGLKLNTELQTAPSGSEDERKAAGELWAALNTPPEKAAEDAKRLGAMEADLKALREQQASLQASVAALTTQLQAERAEREASAPKMLVYALGAALALVVAALAWLLAERRRERSQRTLGEAPWWESESGVRGDPAQVVPASFPAAPVAAPVAASVATATVFAPAAPTPEDNSMAALDVSEGTESSFTEVIDDSPVSMDVLLDLVQEVEFFESLQQQSHAAQLLEQFVQDHPTACELPYLLLMQQAQALGQTERLTELGARYQQTFGTPAPEALCYAAGQAGLDTQPKFMDILTRFWSEEQVLGLLQNTLLAAPGTGLLEKRSLQAFEDALLLYSVAHTLQTDHSLRAPAPVQAGFAAVADTSDPADLGATADTFNRSDALNAPLSVSDTVAAPGPAASGQAALTMQAKAAMELDLDLSFATEHDIPPAAEPPASSASVDDGKGGRELPMLDFDLFATDVPKKDEPPAKT